MPKIHLISLDSLSRTMFFKRGWTIVEESGIDEKTFILFSGGEDVTPELYNHQRHPKTHCNPTRDKYESTLFNKWGNNPKIGICRGGQFLNILSGGTMHQDVDGHLGDHILFDQDTGERILVTSTHHQMMNPSPKAYVVGTANCSSYKETDKEQFLINKNYPNNSDIEILFYPETNSLCYQPHPEYGMKSCEDHFFSVIDRYFEVDQ
jgi:carbamoylphosphate synthase small subunit